MAPNNFEKGLDGFYYGAGQFNWTLHKATTSSSFTGPSSDNTYKNASGESGGYSFLALLKVGGVEQENIEEME